MKDSSVQTAARFLNILKYYTLKLPVELLSEALLHSFWFILGLSGPNVFRDDILQTSVGDLSYCCLSEI